MRRRPAAVLATIALLAPTAVLTQALPASGAMAPTVTLTSPTRNQVVWDELVLSAEATPAEGGKDVARVDFYLDAYGADGEKPAWTDDTAPYEITVPRDELGWAVGSAHRITAVAVDTAGQPSGDPARPGTGAAAFTTLGPPPVVTWAPAPPAPTTAAGSTSAGVQVDFAATVDEVVPDTADAYLNRIEHLLDGEVVHEYRPDGEPRSLERPAHFLESPQLTGGVHRVGIRVTVAYNGNHFTAAEATADVLVADGTRLAGPVMAGNRIVRNGFVVTAGDVVRFRAPIEAKVPGTFLELARLYVDDDVVDQWPLGYRDFVCEGPDTCVASAVIRSDRNRWFVPEVPGRATLTLTSAVFEDRRSTVVRRGIVIQPAARLTRGVSRHRIRRGEAVVVRGRLTRLDNGAPQAGRTVRVQWQRVGTTRWRTVATRTTNRYGRVRARMTPRYSGDYRLLSPEVRGTLGRGLSAPAWVAVRR